MIVISRVRCVRRQTNHWRPLMKVVLILLKQACGVGLLKLLPDKYIGNVIPTMYWQKIIIVAFLMIICWLAIKIGTFVLRFIAGLLFLSFSAYGIWYLFIK